MKTVVIFVLHCLSSVLFLIVIGALAVICAIKSKDIAEDYNPGGFWDKIWKP